MESMESIKESIEKTKGEEEFKGYRSSYLPVISYTVSPKVTKKPLPASAVGDSDNNNIDNINVVPSSTTSLTSSFNVALTANNYLPKEIEGATGSYEILPQITLEIAKELQSQTGLVISFEAGKEVAEFIGNKGHFGQLRLGKEIKTGRYYGIKQIVGEDKVEESLEEARLQRGLTGLPHLMPLVDAIKLEDSQGHRQLYHIMPLAALGNGKELASYLSNIKDKSFKEALLVHVAKCVLKGFKELHERNIAHLDFKPDNLVVDATGNVLVIDFGCTKELDKEGYVKGRNLGDTRYYSPERNASYTSFPGKANDCYSIGLTLLELAVGMIANKKEMKAEDYLTHPYLQDALPGTYAGLVKGLLEINPDKRLKVEEALSLELLAKETKPEILAYLREFVQSLQWEQRVKETKGIQQLTSAQQLPLPHFTGYVHRPIEAKVIARLLEGSSLPIACTGLGGVGKTQLLTYLVHTPEVQARFKSIFWFRASDNETSLNIQYYGLAQELKLIDEKTPLDEAKSILIQWFEHQAKPWLIVFDNADNPETLRPYLPSKGGSILLSSRSPEWREAIALDTLSISEVQEMLSKLMPERTITLEEAKELGKRLGYLPLALSQAIAMIRQEGLDIKEYVESFKQKQKELLRADTSLFGKHLPHSMVTLYQLQLEKLSVECPEANALLACSALLAPDAIPITLMEGLIEGMTLKTDQKAQQLLVRYGLWQLKEDGIYIHRLMQEVIRIPLHQEILNDVFLVLGDRCNREYNKETKVLEDERRRKALLLHLEALKIWGEKEESLKTTISFANILQNIGLYYQHQAGHPQITKGLLETALKIKEKHYGKDHPQTGITLTNLGNAYGSLGEYKKARDYLLRALEVEENHYGKDHVEAGSALTNLGTAYGKLGEYEKQRDYLLRALAVHEKHYGKDHPSTGITLTNLGNAYGSLGEYEKQRDTLLRALTIIEKHYGKDHPETAIPSANLGAAYGKLGEYEKKRDLLLRALTITETHYGKAHPQTGQVLTILGGAYGQLGEYEKMKDFLLRALPITEKHYGKDHPEIGIILGNLSIVYRLLEDTKTAYFYKKRAYDIYFKFYGADHQKTKSAFQQLQELNIASNAFSSFQNTSEPETLKYSQGKNSDLLARNKKSNTVLQYATTLLHYSTFLGPKETIRLLLQRDANFLTFNQVADKSTGQILLRIIHYYEKMIELNPQLQNKVHNLGYYYFLQGVLKKDAISFIKTEKCFQKSLESDPHSGINVEYANFLFYNHRYLEAIPLVVEAIQLQDSKDVFYELLDKASLPEELKAIIEEQQGPVVIKTDVFSYYLLILIYQQLGQFNQALPLVSEYSQAVEKQPAPINYLLLGYSYKLLGLFNEAALCFDEAYQLKSDSLLAKQNRDECLHLAETSEGKLVSLNTEEIDEEEVEKLSKETFEEEFDLNEHYTLFEKKYLKAIAKRAEVEQLLQSNYLLLSTAGPQFFTKLLNLAIAKDKAEIITLLLNNPFFQDIGSKAYQAAKNYAISLGKESLASLIKIKEKRVEGEDDTQQSIIEEEREEILFALEPKATLGEGDCAFHSIFGEWDERRKKFICKDVVNLRKRVAKEIRECTAGCFLFMAVKEAIQQIIISERRGGDEIRKIRKAYQDYLEKNEYLIGLAWENFEKELKSHSVVLDYINGQIPLEKTKTLYTLKLKFDYCLNEDDGTLLGLILSLKDLNEKFREYNNKSNEGFDLASYLENRKLINEYAALMERVGYWLLPGELAIVAYALEVSIDLYIRDGKSKAIRKIETYNPEVLKKSAIYFNSINHYEYIFNNTNLTLDNNDSPLTIEKLKKPAADYGTTMTDNENVYLPKLGYTISLKMEDSNELIEDSSSVAFSPFVGIKRLPKGSVQFNKDNNNFLGKGAFGQVYRGEWNKLTVALKEIDIKVAQQRLRLSEEEVLEALQWEVARLAAASHPNLVQFYGLYIEEDADKNPKTYLVIEYCEGGNLKKALEKSPTWPKCLQWALEITQGLAYLYHQGMVHRDLKAENILIDGHGRAKLADLGVAQVDALLQKEEASVVFKGLQDRCFAAPEALQDASISTPETDIYALGTVFWQLVSQGKQPNTPRYADGSIDEQKLLEQMRTEEREVIPEECPIEFKELILSCWAFAPNKRPKVEEVIKRLQKLAFSYHPEPIWMNLCQQMDVLIHPKRLEGLSYVPSLVTEYQVYEDLDVYWQRLEIQETKNTDKEEDNNNAEKIPMLKIGNPPLKLQQIFAEFLASPQSSTLLLLGESGLGKTLSTYQLADELLSQWWQTLAISKDNNNITPYFPIFIRPSLTRWAYSELKDGFEKALKSYAVQTASINLKEAKFLVIIDGYDECEVDKRPSNLAEELGIKDLPQVKLLVTCRPNTVEGKDLAERFTLKGNLMIRHFLPFNVSQLLGYLKQELNWNVSTYQDYQEKFQKSHSLRMVLRNPFVASLFVQSWKTIKKKEFNQLNRWQIYQDFVEHWITTQHSLLTSTIKEALTINYKNNTALDRLVESFNSLASEIAFNAFQREAITFDKKENLKVTLLSKMSQFWLNLKEHVRQDSERIFKERKERISKEEQRRVLLTQGDYAAIMQWRLQRFETGSPLKNKELLCEFSHRTFFEYFVARRIVDLREKVHSEIVEEAVELLNHRPIQSEPEAMVFLAEGWQEDKTRKLIEPFFEILEISKKQEFSDVRASANAATILNVGRASFSGKNLSGVKIPGADLSYGIFDRTQFQESDLRETNIQGAWLREANFRRALMYGIDFKELPRIFLEYATSCSYSSDGRYLAIANSHFISLYKSNTKVLVRIFRGHTGAVTGIAFSPDSRRFISGSKDGTLRLWDIESGDTTSIFNGHSEGVTGVAFSVDGQHFVSGSYDGTLHLWKINHTPLSINKSKHIINLPIMTFSDENNKSSIVSVAFSPNRYQFASGDYNGDIKIWDIKTGELVRIFERVKIGRTPTGRAESNIEFKLNMELDIKDDDDERIVWSLAFSPDGKLLASANGKIVGSDDSSIKIWDAMTGRFIRALEGHTYIPRSVAFSPDGQKLASSSNDYSVKLWNVTTGALIKDFKGHTNKVVNVAYSGNNELASISLDGTIRFWQLIGNNSHIFKAHGHNQSVLSVTFNPNGQQIASGSYDATIRIWDCETGRCLKILEGHNLGVTSVTFSPDGKKLVSGGVDRKVILWDVESGAGLMILSKHTESVESAVFSPDGLQIASGDFHGNIILWDVAKNNYRMLTKQHNKNADIQIYSLAFSPDGQQLISSGTWLILWELSTGNLSKIFGGHLNGITNSWVVIFTPNGQQFVSSGGMGNYDINLWSIKFNNIIKVFRGHTSRVTSIAFLSGNEFVSASDDGTLRFWDITSGNCIGIEKLETPIRSISVLTTPLGSFLTTGSRDNSVGYWRVVHQSQVQVRLALIWSSRQGILLATNADLEEVNGLSPTNRTLMTQCGAITNTYQEANIGFTLKEEEELIKQSAEEFRESVATQYKLGILYYNGTPEIKQDYKKAAKYFAMAAVKGHMDAKYNLGVCYQNGHGVAKDLKKALECFIPSAEQGDMMSQVNLGNCYLDFKNYEKAFEWYTKSAYQREAVGQYNLGLCYKNGWGVQSNLKQAAEWFTLSAMQGYVKAQYELGCCYYNGHGVPQNYEKAVEYFTLASEQMHSHSQINLGTCYQFGHGVPQNYEKAMEWYTKAADQGDKDAQRNLKVVQNLTSLKAQSLVESTTKLSKIQTLKQQAMQYYQANEYKNALLLFDQALGILQEDNNLKFTDEAAKLHFNIAALYERIQDYALAFPHFKSAYEKHLILLGYNAEETQKDLRRLQRCETRCSALEEEKELQAAIKLSLQQIPNTTTSVNLLPMYSETASKSRLQSLKQADSKPEAGSKENLRNEIGKLEKDEEDIELQAAMELSLQSQNTSTNVNILPMYSEIIGENKKNIMNETDQSEEDIELQAAMKLSLQIQK